MTPLRSGVCRRNCVCHLSVRCVHPTQPDEIFGNVSTPFYSLATFDHHTKFYEDRPKGTFPSGVKRKSVANYSDVGHVEGYISETVQDTATGTIND